MAKGIRITYKLRESGTIVSDVRAESIDSVILEIKTMLSKREDPDAIETIYLNNRQAHIVPVRNIISVEVHDITKEIVDTHRNN